MVTSYYIMKMNAKKAIDMEEYYSGLESAPILPDFNAIQLKCRVCLQNGDISIFSLDNTIKEALKIVGNIDLSEDEILSENLCHVCYKLLKSAILFRKTAQSTSNILKAHFQSQSPDHYHDHDYMEAFEEDKKYQNSIVEEFQKKSIDIKEKVSKIQCSTCNKIVSKSYYKIHSTMHNTDHCNEYVCDICGKTFRLRVGYYKHRLRHRTDYTYNCKLCPFKGRHEEGLKSHMRTHIRDYRYMCTECPARFLFKSNLNHHIVIKHREPQYKCDSCNKGFHTKIILQRHCDVVHLGIKNQICNYCGRAFGYRNAMLKHQRNVHKREKMKLRFEKSNYKPLGNNQNELTDHY